MEDGVNIPDAPTPQQVQQAASQPAPQAPAQTPARQPSPGSNGGGLLEQPANAPTNAQPASGTDVQPGSEQQGQLSPDLVKLASSSAYGFDEATIGKFNSDAELQNAIMQFDLQPQMNPAFQQPQPYPMQQPGFGQQQMQPQMQPQQQGQPQQFGQPQTPQPPQPPQPIPGMPEFDRDAMDPQQLQAFDYLSQTINTQNQQMEQVQQQMEHMAYQSYMNEMTPLISELKDTRLDAATPFGQSTVEQFLMQVEDMRASRMQRGMRPSNTDLVSAVYQMFKQSQGSANQQGMSNQFIGQPGNQHIEPSANPDQRARNAMGQWVSDDPMQVESSKRDEAVLNNLPEG